MGKNCGNCGYYDASLCKRYPKYQSRLTTEDCGLHKYDTRISTGPTYQNLLADAYQPMTQGIEGTLLTVPMMETDDKIIVTSPRILRNVWANPEGGVYSSLIMDNTYPSPVEVDAIEYEINSGISWKWRNKDPRKYIRHTIVNDWESTQFYEKYTMFGYIVIGHDGNAQQEHDILVMNGSWTGSADYSAVQIKGTHPNLTMNIHSEHEVGDAYHIPLELNKRYFFNQYWDGVDDGVTGITLYDPLDDFSEVGTSSTTLEIISGVREVIETLLCRSDTHGPETLNPPSAENYSMVSNVGFNFSGAYPILPVTP